MKKKKYIRRIAVYYHAILLQAFRKGNRSADRSADIADRSAESRSAYIDSIIKRRKGERINLLQTPLIYSLTVINPHLRAAANDVGCC
jgi:hypothetical protein